MYITQYSPKALKDLKKLKKTVYFEKANRVLDSIKQDPYNPDNHMEYLSGNMEGYISKRINIQHRIVYQVLEDRKIVRILRMWTHYE